MSLAKDVVGNFANLRPDNPGRFFESVGQVLEQYPLGIAQECADPINGISAKVEFLSLKSLIEWCDDRLSFYRALSTYRAPPAPREIEPGPVTAEQCGNLMAQVAAELRASNSKSPLDILHKQVADARRLRVSEVIRTSEGPFRG